MRCTLATAAHARAVTGRGCGKGAQAADVLVVLAAEVELESLEEEAGEGDELAEGEELDVSAVEAAGVSVLGLFELLELPERLSVL